MKMEYLSGAQMAPPIMSYPRNLSYLKNICSVLVTLEISIRSCSLFGRERERERERESSLEKRETRGKGTSYCSQHNCWEILHPSLDWQRDKQKKLQSMHMLYWKCAYMHVLKWSVFMLTWKRVCAQLKHDAEKKTIYKFFFSYMDVVNCLLYIGPKFFFYTRNNWSRLV